MRWHDNNVVTVATNHDSLEQLHDVKGMNKRQEKCRVKNPTLISNYNERMDGVDHRDWLVSKYTLYTQYAVFLFAERNGTGPC